jgi:hypothetical protein
MPMCLLLLLLLLRSFTWRDIIIPTTYKQLNGGLNPIRIWGGMGG